MTEKPSIHPSPRSAAKLGGANAFDGIAALSQIVNAARDLVILCQTENTKRARIDAYGKAEIARIKAAEAILAGYFDQVFTERRSTFETLFARLDSALESKDAQAVNAIVGGIVDVAKSSPLADLGDLGQIRAALDDPDQVWDL